MALSSPSTVQFLLPSAPPGPPGTATVPPNKAPLTLSDFDLPLHYTLRNFKAPTRSLPLSLADIDYHSVKYWEEVSTAELGDIESEIVGNEDWSTFGLTQADLNLLTQDQLDLMTQRQLESAAGIGEVVTWAYQTGMIVSVPTTGLYFSSKFNDNLLVPPFNGAGPYYIELVLRDFPSELSTPRLDISQSYILFSSSDQLVPEETDIVFFDESISDITTGGNVTWRINRDRLVNADISNLKRIDFNLIAAGGTISFRAEAMRMVPSTYPYYKIGIDTKSGYLSKNPSINGTNISSQPTPPPIMNVGSNKGKNFTEVVRFNTGHHPTSPDYNEFSTFLRADTGSGNYIEVIVRTNDTDTAILVYEGGTGVRQVTVNTPLVEDTDYLLTIDLLDNNLRAIIWGLRGHYRTTVALNTETGGIINISRVEPGWVAYSMNPVTADFYLDYTYARDAALAEVSSKTFYSVLPVRGVTLYTQNSGPVEILDESLVEEGPAANRLNLKTKDSGVDDGSFLITPNVNDVAVSLDSTVTNSSLDSFKVRKHLRNAFIGGLQWDQVIRINDPLNATIKADIRFDTALNYGAFRFVLFDKFWESVAFVNIVNIDQLVLNKWNELEIPILNEEIFHNEFKLQIHHIGVDTTKATTDSSAIGTFWVDNVKVETKSIIWEASNDGGLSYLRFFDTLNNKFQGVSFPEQNNQLKIKARAFNTKAWINSFETIVHYGQPGRIIE